MSTAAHAPQPLRKHWKVKTQPTADDAALAAALGIAPITATVLRARGYSSQSSVQQFLDPALTGLHDPTTLPDIAPAIARLQRAIVGNEPFLIFGDYDVDGITSTAMLTRTLRALGAHVEARIPERADGYGLSIAAVEAAAARGQKLILTADNGIRALEAAQRARELGIDLIITDHHEPGPELPDALAVINPKRADSTYPFHELCGCGVAFKVMLGLLLAHWPKAAASFTQKFADLVALATIADCVPLVDENRILAYAGLQRLGQSKKPGLQALLRSAGITADERGLCGRHISFRLAPRLNAAGRMASAAQGLQLLLSTDAAECETLAFEIETHNRARQQSTEEMTLEAMLKVRDEVDLDCDPMIVLAHEGWSHGLVGLVASRLVESYGRPTILLAIHNGTARGSGRSIQGFDLGCVLDAARDLLLSGGGHQAACGLSLETHRIEEFRERVLDCASDRLDPEDLVPTLEADCEVRATDITAQLVRDLEKLEPCGQANGEPLFMLCGARIQDGRQMGQNNEHVKWKLQAENQQLEAVWWRPGQRAKEFGQGSTVDLCFAPELNHWNGNTRIQLVVKEVRAHE